MTSANIFLQSPMRNASVVGANVFSHSGEFSPAVVDFTLPGRGVSFLLARKYRSANSHAIGMFGRGWTFTHAKSLARVENDLLYHDGLGRSHFFEGPASKDTYKTPNGMYATLEAEKYTFCLKQRGGRALTFEAPPMGGRLLSVEDRNKNAIRFNYVEGAIQISDSLGRQVELRLEQNLVVSMNYAGRVWRYVYDDNSCLVEKIGPTTSESPSGARTQYTYNEAFQLTSISDPNGATFLRNSYDDRGRISHQRHGNGSFKFEYESLGETNSRFPIYRTHVQLKNGSLLALQHDDFGHVVRRDFPVAIKNISTDDSGGAIDGTLVLSTISTFNRHGENLSQLRPAGDAVSRTYDDQNTDPRARGNLLQVSCTPATGADNDQSELVTQFSYEPQTQQVVSITDPRGSVIRFEYDNRGNLVSRLLPTTTIRGGFDEKHSSDIAQLAEHFAYNDAGQLTRSTDVRGFITEYYYHPISEPNGRGWNENLADTQKPGGYFARSVRDASINKRDDSKKPVRLTVRCHYDAFGNLTTVLDGKANASHFEYDSHNRLIQVVSRAPFGYKIGFRYDANDNLTESSTSFVRYYFDPIKDQAEGKEDTIYRRFEYNNLNNVVRRTIVADGRELSHSIIRDADESVIREIQPMGNVVEREYDERGLPISQRFSPGTPAEIHTRYTYTLNGDLGSATDGRANTVHHRYDGFQRYKGFSNKKGTVKTQWFDECGNVIRAQVYGDFLVANELGDVLAKQGVPLLETWFQYDELNRLVRLDRAWNDPLTGASLGQSTLCGKDGLVSAAIEYDGHLPSKVRHEAGKVLQLHFDGADRFVSLADDTGESLSVRYDENCNPIRLERHGPTQDGGTGRLLHILNQRFDELDRVVTRSTDNEPPEQFTYNSLGLVVEHKNQVDTSTKQLHDQFGRRSGRVTVTETPPIGGARQSKQILAQRLDWDDNGRLAAYTNGTNHSTRYGYDSNNLLSSVVFADGTAKNFQRDANGNVVRKVDANTTTVTNRFDEQDRLVERSITRGDLATPTIEKFSYDGLNRLVSASTDSAITLRHYDSLSRVLSEAQSGKVLRYAYDSAGNCVSLLYPGGREVRKSYDAQQRITEIRDGQLVAAYSYASSTQIKERRSGNVLRSTYVFENGRDRLRSITHQAGDSGKIIGESTYTYDVSGNVIREDQLQLESRYSQDLIYDDSGRLVSVSYGAARSAKFDIRGETEVIYKLSRSGTWQSKITRDGHGQTLEQDVGVANERDVYLSLGKYRFEYDANGNRTLEEDQTGEGRSKKFSYDYANRLIRIDTLARSGMIAETIEYAYDTNNRQVLKRLTKDGRAREFVRVWNGDQLIEEWIDGKLAKSVTYGARNNEPLKLSLTSNTVSTDYCYVLDGRGSITGLLDERSRVFEGYRYDAFGQPVLTMRDNHHTDEQVSFATANPLLSYGRLYDGDAELSISNSSLYDAKTGQIMADTDPPPGPVEIGPQASFPWTPDPRSYLGNLSTWTPPSSFDGDDQNYPASVGANGLVVVAASYGIYRLTAGIPAQGYFGYLVRKAVGGLLVEGLLQFPGDASSTPSDSSQGSGNRGNSSSNGGSSSSNSSGAGHPSGQPEYRPSGNGIDYGHEGGTGDGEPTTGGVDAPASNSPKDAPSNKQPTLTNDEMVVNGEATTEGTDEPINNDPPKPSTETPNPIDGGDGDIDKDWWRNLPNRDAAAALQSGLTADENLVELSRSVLGGSSYLNSVLSPSPISVEAGGEGVVLNLAGLHSRGSYAGTATADGWGDKPRSLAEAAVAPRMRDTSVSRF
ncbi:DUF6531 domain-containing protein [Mesorhizobium sp. M0019]|uniref:DUF6531 domain-containing protein n=1 Tax=Mesorhizobium sp. M0019 TaxID=2956845 RepID=UPI00333CB507